MSNSFAMPAVWKYTITRDHSGKWHVVARIGETPNTEKDLDAGESFDSARDAANWIIRTHPAGD